MLQVRIELRGGFATHVGRTSFADQSGQGLNVCFWPVADVWQEWRVSS